MNCEMCGSSSDKLIKVRISGAVLTVCPNCAKFGEPVEEKKLNNISETLTIKFPEKKINVVTYKKPFKKTNTAKKPVKRENVEELDVVEDYSNIIKNKREEMNMTQDDLAKKIFERKNVLSNIERGELLPNINIARKLEKVLNIKLLEKN
ncbi:multiprotein bridging factor aMBF1 [Ferroplasma sp.]|uniref:multiprotein bridging factor aMBF1 n=1 Tax=Ferroplasma sp. TaxID=2591003 RepID=UPI00307E650A